MANSHEVSRNEEQTLEKGRTIMDKCHKCLFRPRATNKFKTEKRGPWPCGITIEPNRMGRFKGAGNATKETIKD